MLAWHARAFLRLALRAPPDGVAAAQWGAAWRCSGTLRACADFRPASGAEALAHAATCGNATSRHHCYGASGREVLFALPGRPRLRVEVPGVPAAGCQMDVVAVGVTAPAAPSAGPGAAPDARDLLVDFSVVEPCGRTALLAGSHAEAGVAAVARRGEKERRYGALLDPARQRLLPWVVETWGRHDPQLVLFLRGAARLAAEARLAPQAADDAAAARLLARVAASIFSTWMQRLSAGVVVAVAEHLDARFRPLRGVAARQAFRGVVPRGLEGRCALDHGLVGPGGQVRSMEPRFGFWLPLCC
jgi:hypothetical protein